MTTEIWADGACSGNPGPGGWACLIRRGKQEQFFSGSISDTTNNRMELTAVIAALEMLHEKEDATVYSDSQYVVNGITKWVHNWQKKNWVTSTNSRVQNIDLWEKLLDLSKKHQIQFKWIRGHSTEEIDLVDKFAKRRSKTMSRAEIVALSITLIFLVAEIWLFIQYPLLMFTLLVAALTIMWILTKFAKYDYELWPDLYKK